MVIPSNRRRLLLYWLIAPALAQTPYAPPVLGVCELLRNLDAWRGKGVVVVARVAWTFEGNFASEKCAPDERILIQGNKWLSALAWRTEAVGDTQARPLPVDEAAVTRKVLQLNGGALLHRDDAKKPHGIDMRPHWTVGFGRVVSPERLRPYRKGAPGNGYGANGTVPAAIDVAIEHDLGSAE